MSDLVEEEYDIELVDEHLAECRNALIVHNLTAIADCGIALDLDDTSTKFSNSIYEPKEFKCIRIDVRVRSLFDTASRLPNSNGFEHIQSIKVLEATKVATLHSAVNRGKKAEKTT